MAKKENSETIFWKPSEADRERSQMAVWMKEKGFSDYEQFHNWSVTHKEDFWKEWLLRSGAHFEGNLDRIYLDPPQNSKDFLGGEWFPDLQLNYAENLIKNLSSSPITHWEESGATRSWTREEFLGAIQVIQKHLRSANVKKGDVVAGILPHRPETLAAMLATTAIGAVWTTCSPDFGVQGIVDRFSQVNPKVLFTVSSTEYNGKRFELKDKSRETRARIPSIVTEINLSEIDYNEKNCGPLQIERLPFSHPLYILYSSGTTGAPKCLIHTAGGSLLQHLKELKLHCDLKPGERIFYFTTCGWMMWNWVISSLACGAELHTYEGSPSYPRVDSLWDRVAKNKIHVFGTSAKYISSCRIANAKNLHTHRAPETRLVLSTGSPLLPEDFDYFYQEVSPDHKVQLASISGGTDIVSCFMLGCPVKNVVRGEIQCLGLGMDVQTYNDAGQSLTEEEGELICAQAFPSMPLAFVNDPGHKKYHAAYFEHFPGVWHHGDYVIITQTRGVKVLGRSDATLNPGGVRIGTAEIYRQVETLEDIKDSLVVGRSLKGDEEVILFVQLKDGKELSDELKTAIKKRIREGASPRHVPAQILAVKSIPYTLSGKKVEIAVKNLLAGREPKNIEALANPESLIEYRSWAAQLAQ